MFHCGQPSCPKVPNHIAVIPDSLNKTSYLTLIEWGIQHELTELSLFVWPNSYWAEDTVKLKQEWDLLYQELSELYCQYKFVTSNHKMPVNPIPNNKGMMVTMYVSYGFDECIKSVGSNPDVLICTGGYHDLNNFCMDKLSSTEFKFTNVLFEHCDEEVWDDFFSE